MKPLRLYFLIACWAALRAASFGTGLNMEVDPSQKHAWGENAGWFNFSPTHSQAILCYNGANSFLSGYAWSENVGWVKLGSDSGGPYLNSSAANWGVNMDAAWRLSGYAWSENAGWINFSPTRGGVFIDSQTGAFSGYGWAENLGWMHFANASPAYKVRCVVATATNQVPQWWLWSYGWTNDFDSAAAGDQDGDGMYTWEEYTAGTVPTNGASFLGLLAAQPEIPAGVKVRWQSVSGRTYKVYRSPDLGVPSSFTTLRTGIAGQPGATTVTDTNAPGAGPYFYRVGVQR